MTQQPEVAQRSSTTIGPQSPLHSAWAFMYLYSEGLYRILRGLAKFTFLFTYVQRWSQITVYANTIYGILQSPQT